MSKNKTELTFSTLREANTARLPTFRTAKGEIAHSKEDGSDWSLSDWSNAVLGELGEAANIIKKLRRPDFELDDRPPEFKGLTVREALAEEFADTVTYLDILAMQVGVDLGQATFDKFNKISKRVDSPITLRASTRLDDLVEIAQVKRG